MKALKLSIWIVLSLFILFFFGCTGGGTGTMSLSITDATTDEYKAVYVTIEEVSVHVGGNEHNDSNWEVVGSPGKTYNLLDLVNGVIEQLGIIELQAGHYTQMRLIIGEVPDDGINLLSETHPYANYIIHSTDEKYELKIPSGLQTGIKIIHGFDINEDQTTELILDFDASRSIVKAGASGQWLLKPTIKVIDEYSIINGTVSDGIQNLLEGALVSVQIFDPGAEDEKDKVVVQASTITDENGNYKILVQPGAYNIVAYKDNYIPGCVNIETVSNTVYTREFSLNDALSGTVSGVVEITEGGAEQHVTISFRQIGECEGKDIEVKSLNVANGGPYSTVLTVGSYNVVASTYDSETQMFSNVVVYDSDTTSLDITF